jgi:hypothetical protein
MVYKNQIDKNKEMNKCFLFLGAVFGVTQSAGER